MSEFDIAREVDRYLCSPGQATSYKIGQLKFLELRKKAGRSLGRKFDIRDYHEAVLENGSLPLEMLEAQFDAYIERKR